MIPFAEGATFCFRTFRRTLPVAAIILLPFTLPVTTGDSAEKFLEYLDKVAMGRKPQFPGNILNGNIVSFKHRRRSYHFFLGDKIPQGKAFMPFDLPHKERRTDIILPGDSFHR